MRIGELSKRTGFKRDAIRFYERQGLISAPRCEGDNNYKSYREDFDGDAFLRDKIEQVETRIQASTRFLDTLRQTRAALAVAPLS